MRSGAGGLPVHRAGHRVRRSDQHPHSGAADPALNSAQTVFTSTTVTTEKLTATRPDVVFVSNNSQIAAKTTELGIPTLQLIFQNFDDLKKVVTTTADVLGPDAQAQSLQVQWAATLLHPELFTELNMVAVAKNFYTRFRTTT
jgi:ABC-type Fe3+-hydroxamate transport system substrate-binding protein